MSQQLDTIIESSNQELKFIMEKWCREHDGNCSGGKMRYIRGDDIETFCRNVVQRFNDVYGVNVSALKGANDKKKLSLKCGEQILEKDHQVDVHIYKDNTFIAVIECKAYLDSCYYVRACDDFKLFKKFGYDVKHYIFSLENSIDTNTKAFTDEITDHICDDIFYVLDGKRVCTKPVYDKEHKKEINKDKLEYFIKSLYGLLVGI